MWGGGPKLRGLTLCTPSLRTGVFGCIVGPVLGAPMLLLSQVSSSGSIRSFAERSCFSASRYPPVYRWVVLEVLLVVTSVVIVGTAALHLPMGLQVSYFLQMGHVPSSEFTSPSIPKKDSTWER